MAIAAPDWERLLDSARVKLPGSTDAMLKNEIFDVMHEFFTVSSAWTEHISLPIVADVTTYDLVPSEGQIIRLAGVIDVNGIPQPALMPTIGALDLAHPVNTSQTFTVVVVKTVVLPVDCDKKPEAPDWLLPVWGPGILDGVLGRMMGQLQKGYTSPAMSLYHLKRFINAMSAARIAALRRNSFGSQAWAFPQFGRGSQRGGFSTSNVGGF